ncbi:MAG TPA: hypothetical protein PLS24_07440, partial [Sedimentisphaerales bacterium]|nr:hypothetical protein [Sedimentisphaerales bacterium]
LSEPRVAPSLVAFVVGVAAVGAPLFACFVGHTDDLLRWGTEAFFLLTGRGVSATIPVPGALLLTAVGTGLVGMIRRRLM